MAHNSNSIPIRVIPGSTELVKDTSTGAFHLNVGFHLSFNVKELMQALAKMTDIDVTIKAESSVPISGQQSAQTMQQPAQKEKEPPQKKNDEKLMGLGGPLKTTEPNQKIVDDSITWESKLIKLSPAAQEYREQTGIYDPVRGVGGRGGGCQATLNGSFSVASKPIFASKCTLESSRRDLQDLHAFAPLRRQYFSKISSNFVAFFCFHGERLR